MTLLPQDLASDLERRIAELERGQHAQGEENLRLRHELAIARDWQRAAAEILATIAASSGDADHALRQIADTTVRLFNAASVTLRIVGNPAAADPWSQTLAVGPGGQRIAAAVANSDLKIGGRNFPGTVVAENRQIHLPDIFNVEPAYADFPGLRHARAAGSMVMAGTPLRREGKAIGALIVHRDRPEPFTEDELALQQSFADQAVIAIENARLFNEVQQRTRDLTESLQQQTATAEVLQVISNSPGELGPVFQAVLENATRICDARFGTLLRFENGAFYFAADLGTPAPLAEFVRRPGPFNGLPGGMIDRILKTRQVHHTADYAADPAPGLAAKLGGARSTLGVPILKDDVLVGAIVIYRQEVRPFSEREIELVRSFAAQSAIAIENARLFNETREALERQTATADILKVIASSPSDVQPVFEAIAASANRLIGGFSTAVFRFLDDVAHLAAFTPSNPAADAMLRAAFPSPLSEFGAFETAKSGRTAQIADTEQMVNSHIQGLARARGFRSMLLAPLMNNGVPIGLISVTRPQTGTFADHHVQLLQTFADQAVIAIENVRLFEEVQQRTRDLAESLQQQTATAEVLKVISRSAFDLQTVLDTLAESAAQLCEADEGVIARPEGEAYRLMAIWGASPEKTTFLRSIVLKPGSNTAAGRALLERRTVQIADTRSDPASALPGDPDPARTRLGVPLLREGAPIGVFVLVRRDARPFTDKQIELVQTFADQAVIAIENARLFDEVQATTRELTQSLNDLRTAQDRLIQTEKLASLGQLTAGIAHEIKNPLNFVNNFAALSAELTDELNDALRPAALDDDIRDEVDELTGMLKDNLQKVVQHGKRADSIVKNMLLHSREGSGEHRPTDVNALVEESLNLAYHGARAEKPQFNVTIERDLDPEAGTIEVFPQEITRVLLNLISNGFYAVSKRKADNGGSGFEPVLKATTCGRTSHVEIRIRDNGTGIPDEVREKMFNPFFTTKPAGEGTGLGLSMSHDIVVKQHGGTIDVVSLPGEFTEFTISLPRTSIAADRTRG